MPATGNLDGLLKRDFGNSFGACAKCERSDCRFPDAGGCAAGMICRPSLRSSALQRGLSRAGEAGRNGPDGSHR